MTAGIDERFTFNLSKPCNLLAGLFNSIILLVLTGAGEISGNGNIKALFLPEINSLLIRTSRPLAKIVSGFTGEANLAVEVSGTLNKPVYRARPYFKYPLEGVKDYLEELIK